MTTKVVPGVLVAEPDAQAVAREAAACIAQALEGAVARGGRATLALSGGESPRAAYALLARDPRVNWSQVDVFWVDERAVPATDDRSNYRWAKATLIDAAALPPERVHRMPADAADGPSAAREYERVLRERVELDQDGIPAIDVVVLGVGDDGHTASLFPGESTVDVSDRLVATVPARPPREARMTLTAPVIEHARAVVLIVVGRAKHAALERVWAATGTARDVPARVVHGCRGSVTWVVDQAAVGMS